MNFFRAQGKGISFEEMKNYNSAHCTEDGDYSRPGGLAACLSADGLDGGSQFGGAPIDEDAEIVIFRGRIIEEIYDGYLVEPLEEVARFPALVWDGMIDNGEAWDYEDYS